MVSTAINYKMLNQAEYLPKTFVKDPVSAGTHFFGCVAAVFMTPVLLIHAAGRGASTVDLAALSVYMMSMIMLYAASAAYHTVRISPKVDKIFKKMDHMMIFVLIAGSYTPVLLIGIKGNVGTTFTVIIWSIAAVGMILKFCWVTCPKWFSSVIYIAMGWMCVFIFPQIIRIFTWQSLVPLAFGGLMYTIGGVIYALKLQVFNTKAKYVGSHEIFHIFVLLGSFFQFLFMYKLL